MAATPPPPVELPANSEELLALPIPTVYVTGHNEDGKAVVQAKRPIVWVGYDQDQMAMAEAWSTTELPSDLTDDKDVKSHEARMAGGNLGLVVANGTVLRYVSLAPGYECAMHRTVSVDYGIVLDGEVVSHLDSEEQHVLKAGDVMVQRATMHAWRNPSATKWAHMVFCLQACKPPTVQGERLLEDLGLGAQIIPPSENARG